MSHSNAYPWCYAKKDKIHPCTVLRTATNVLVNYKAWNDVGVHKERAGQNFL